MAQPRRPFTVERRMRERGEIVASHLAKGVVAETAPANGSAGPGGEIPPDMLAELRALTQEIVELRSQVDSKAQSDGWDGDDGTLRDIRIEIARMVREIGRAKSELAALKHPMSDDDPVQAANTQLESIVSTTEAATNTIMNATDEIEDLIGRGKAMATGDTEMQNMFDDMSNKVIAIIEACSFQDLTGQRITKVIGTLRFIEQRILAMIDIWGIEAFQDLTPESAEPEGEPGEALSGPALEGQGLSQADIDALFD